jgi:hypothetical protein
MNPPNNEASGMQLPAPVAEQAGAAGHPAEVVQGTQEQAVAARPAAGPATSVPAAPMPLPSVPRSQIPQNSAVSTTTQLASPAIADDGDLIEKAWVDKAKAIVERNRDDPHKQSDELTVVKADYLQQRYNKTIKLNT